jgi:hypothetical protein
MLRFVRLAFCECPVDRLYEEGDFGSSTRPSPCKKADPEPPEKKQSAPKNRRENQILPPVLLIDLGRRKDRAAIATVALSEEKRKTRKGSDHVAKEPLTPRKCIAPTAASPTSDKAKPIAKWCLSAQDRMPGR